MSRGKLESARLERGAREPPPPPLPAPEERSDSAAARRGAPPLATATGSIAFSAISSLISPAATAWKKKKKSRAESVGGSSGGTVEGHVICEAALEKQRVAAEARLVALDVEGLDELQHVAGARCGGAQGGMWFSGAAAAAQNALRCGAQAPHASQPPVPRTVGEPGGEELERRLLRLGAGLREDVLGELDALRGREPGDLDAGEGLRQGEGRGGVRAVSVSGGDRARSERMFTSRGDGGRAAPGRLSCTRALYATERTFSETSLVRSMRIGYVIEHGGSEATM